jgi:phytoene/squalene synthetase
VHYILRQIMTIPKARLDFAAHIDFRDILTNPILDIAARFWEDDRYEAFKVCYRSMRRIDDLVDHRKSSTEKITPAEAELLASMIHDWLESVRRKDKVDTYQSEFLATLDQFALPLWPWERLCEAMVFDLRHESFASLHVFLRYTEGAAVAPAAIFMHLCGVTSWNSGYRAPGYDIRQAARDLAIFSYLVHILRDFEKDQKSGLNYFADDIVAQHDLSAIELHRTAIERTASGDFRRLVETYKRIAEYYQQRSRATVDNIRPCLAPRYQLSLEIIYGLYSQIFERVHPRHGQFTTEALNPTPAEIQSRIEQIVERFRPSEL